MSCLMVSKRNISLYTEKQLFIIKIIYSKIIRRAQILFKYN